MVTSTPVGSQSPDPIAHIFAKQIGSYVIKPCCAVTKYCANRDISDIASETSIKANHKKLSAHFTSGREQLLNDEYLGWLLANALTFGPLFVFVIISTALAGHMIFEFFLGSRCPRFRNGVPKFADDSPKTQKTPEASQAPWTPRESPQKERLEEIFKRKRCRICMFISNYILITILACVVLSWMPKFQKSIDKIDMAVCGSATIFNELINGVSAGEDLQFAGMKGIKYY